MLSASSESLLRTGFFQAAKVVALTHTQNLDCGGFEFAFFRAVAVPNVFIQNLLEVLDDGVAAESGHEAAVDVDGGFGLFEGAGERDADVGMLRFAGSVDDAAHHGKLEIFDARILGAPCRHAGAEVVLNLLGEFLEKGACCAAAAGACGDLGCETPDTERLQDLLGGEYFFGAAGAGFGGEGDADGVSDAGKKQRREAGRGGDDAFHTHAGFGESEVKWVIAAGGEHLVDVDEVADAGDFAADDDLVVAETVTLRGGGGIEGTAAHGFEHDVACGRGIGAL